MAKKKIDFDKYASALFTRTEQYADNVRKHFASAVGELLKLSANSHIGPDETFSFSSNKRLSEKANNVLRGLYSAVYNEIKNGVSAEWDNANLSCDALIESIFGKGLNEDNHFARWFSRNQEAMDSFFARKSAYGGMNLSQKVWKYTGDLKTEMELALSLSLGQGDSASTVSRKVRQYLQEPDKLFRRIKTGVDENGNPKYKLSKSAKAYHPGQGVYRSSYKNAMRLTRTETNMAYRAAEQDRWQRMDFVVGYEIVRSKHHYPCSLCESLAGKYPKDFVFRGWHPQCRCYVKPILAEEDEFLKMQQDILDGKEPTSTRSVNTIRKPSEKFYDWLADNKDRLESATVMPYWMQDNQDYINKKRKIKVKTDAEREAIRKKWAERAKKNQLTIKMANNVAKIAQEYPEIDVMELQIYIDNKNIALMNNEARKVAKRIAEVRKDEKALSALIPNVHEWKKQFTSAELHAVFDAVEKKIEAIKGKTLNTYKFKTHLQQELADLDFEIKYVADPTKYKTGAIQYPTWKVSQAAYYKQRDLVLDAIDWQNIDDVLQEALTFKTKSKPYLDLIDELKLSITAKDKTKAQSIVADMQAKREALKRAAEARAKKRNNSIDGNVVFDDKCFTNARKKKANYSLNKSEGEDYFFDNAINTYSVATKEMKEAAESYTRASGSITKMLRGADGYFESEMYYAQKSAKEIEALTDMIKGKTFTDDVWLVRDERLAFTIMKAGGFDISSLERNMLDFEQKVMAKFQTKLGSRITLNQKKKRDELIAWYRKRQENKLIGLEGVDNSFLSCGSNQQHKFSGTGGDNKYGLPKTRLEIYCPKGTQGIYAAPFNHYNHKNLGSDGFWDGKSKTLGIYEAEVILQRGGKYRIIEARYDISEDRWYIKCELVSQILTEIDGYEFITGKGYKTKFK